MSKFRTRLRNVGRQPGGIGFGVLARTPRTRHVLVVVEVTGAPQAAEAAAAGVDAIVMRGTPGALAGLKLEGGVLLGIWLEDATGAEVTAAKEAGADFFLFDDSRAHASA